MPAAARIRPDAVAIYIRWSTDEQTDGTTLQTQRERCGWYVQSQGWAVNPELIFIDDGCSGASLHRPALSRLREAVCTGRVDCVVSYSLDRLSRSVADTIALVQEEWRGRCVYRSASQPISTDEGNPTGQLIFNILASFAEFERALIRERTHTGLVRRARAGHFPGCRTAPYGYRRDGVGHLSIDCLGPDGTLQGPAAVVQRIFALAAAGPHGQGPLAIARTLAAEGVPGPTGGDWLAPTVRQILCNPVYVGDLVYGRKQVNPARRRDRSAPQRLRREQPLACVRGALPALVARELWDRVQALASTRRQPGAPVQAKRRALLTGIAACKCGGPLAVYYDRHGRRYYRCNRNTQRGTGCPHRPGVLAADALEEVVVAAVRERYETAALWQSARQQARQLLQQDRHHMQRQAAGRLQTVAARLARLRRAALQGEITPATYEELRQAAGAEATQLRRALAAPAAQAGAAPDMDAWLALDLPRQRAVLQGLFRRIIAHRTRHRGAAPEVDLIWEQSD